MRREWRAIAAVLLIAALPAAAAADGYKLDQTHSAIEFKIRHLGLSKVSGSFHEFQGIVNYDPEAMDKNGTMFTIQTATIDTRNEERDEHLRSADFFDVEKYPEIRFESTKVWKNKAGEWMLRGTLKMRGMEKTVQFPFEIVGPVEDPWGGTRIGFQAELEIKREDWNVGWEKLQFRPPLIGNDVEIEISLEMIREN